MTEESKEDEVDDEQTKKGAGSDENDEEAFSSQDSFDDKEDLDYDMKDDDHVKLI